MPNICRAVDGRGVQSKPIIFEVANLPNSLARSQYGAVVHRDGKGKTISMELTVEGQRFTYSLGRGGTKPAFDILAPVVFAALIGHVSEKDYTKFTSKFETSSATVRELSNASNARSNARISGQFVPLQDYKIVRP